MNHLLGMGRLAVGVARIRCRASLDSPFMVKLIKARSLDDCKICVVSVGNSKMDEIVRHKEIDFASIFTKEDKAQKRAGHPKEMHFGSVFRGEAEKRDLHCLAKHDWASLHASRLKLDFHRPLCTFTHRLIDWVAMGAVTSVSNQHRTNACYAFAAVAVVESLHYIITGILLKLSVQYIVDEITDSCEYCMTNALEFIIDNGLPLWEDHPFKGKLADSANIIRLAVTGYEKLNPDNVDELIKAILKQPIMVSIKIPEELEVYTGGIIMTWTLPDNEEFESTHAVVIVGYGCENGVHYFLCKNSYGEEWGEKGYFRVAVHACRFVRAIQPTYDDGLGSPRHIQLPLDDGPDPLITAILKGDEAKEKEEVTVTGVLTRMEKEKVTVHGFDNDPEQH